jgi:hypothetical protein
MLEIIAIVAGSCVAAVFACIKCYCWREKAKSRQRVVEILHSMNGYQPVNTNEEYV